MRSQMAKVHHPENTASTLLLLLELSGEKEKQMHFAARYLDNRVREEIMSQHMTPAQTIQLRRRGEKFVSRSEMLNPTL